MARKVKIGRQSRPGAEQERLFKRLVVLFGAGAVLWVLFAPTGLVSLLRTRAAWQDVHEETVRLEKENELLTQEIDSLENDPVYFEQTVRSEYNMLKPNELVFDFSKKSPFEKKEKEEGTQKESAQAKQSEAALSETDEPEQNEQQKK